MSWVVQSPKRWEGLPYITAILERSIDPIQNPCTTLEEL